MKGAIFILVALALSGCATTKNAGVTGNSVSVTISNVWNQSIAMQLADKHCQKYGKAARYVGGTPENYHFSFDCVTP